MHLTSQENASPKLSGLFRGAIALVLAYVTALLLSGCSHTQSGDFKRRFDQANNYFGDYFELYYVPSGGWIADREFVKISAQRNPSSDARRLALMMIEGENKLTKLAVYCPSADKMATILLNAAYINRDRKLPHLEVLYIGDDVFEQKLATAVENLGAKFYFASF